MLQEQIRRHVLTVLHSSEEWGRVGAVHGIHIGAILQEQFDDVKVVEGRRPVGVYMKLD